MRIKCVNIHKTLRTMPGPYQVLSHCPLLLLLLILIKTLQGMHVEKLKTSFKEGK